jgi:hypothetical protein
VLTIWVIIIYTIVSTVTVVLNGAALAEAVMRLPSVLIQTAAWITLVFAGIEFVAVRYPNKLPPVTGIHAKWSCGDVVPLEPDSAARGKSRSYAQAVTEVIFGFVFLAWLLLVPEHPFLMLGPGVAYLHASPYRIAPIWVTFYWWIVGLNAIQLAWKCVDLLRGAWRQPDRFQQIAVKAFGLIPLVLLANVRDRMYVLLKRPDLDMAQHAQTLASINNGIHQALLVICIIAALQLAWDIAGVILDFRRRAAAAR